MGMEVYIEYVIIDNLIIDMLVLLCIKATLKLNTKFWKIFLAAIIGTIFACLMPILSLSELALIPIKLALGVAMVLVLAKYSTFKEFLFAYLLLVLYTMLLVGACIVTLMLFGTDIDELKAGYSTEFPVGIVILMVALYVAIVVSIAKYLGRKRNISSYVKSVTLKIGDKLLNINGFVDTGNNLIDPKSGLPVVILSLSCLERFFTSTEIENLMISANKTKNSTFKGVRILKYGTVGGDERQMIVFEADGLCINDQTCEYKTNKFLVGVTYKKFNDAIKYDMLLNPSIL